MNKLLSKTLFAAIGLALSSTVALADKTELTVSSWLPEKTLFSQVEDKRVIIALPKEFTRVPSGEKLSIRFKWSDNMQDERNPIDWLVHGDTAPNGRALYRWVSPE